MKEKVPQSPLAPADRGSALARDVEAFLSAWIDGRALPANLRSAVRYALLGGGKRIRPLLTLHSACAAGGSFEVALPPAGAIELVHTFSLVHDDLPAMDDDDLRRGRPTLHKHAGEAMAILAGDALLGLAFELLAGEATSPRVAASLCRELAVATNDMIAGQVYDTLPDFPEDVGLLARLETIHRHKTLALIRCACRMGGIAAGASDRELAALSRYADAVGLMFQVVDDILDVTQTTEHLGKRARKDAEQGKLTYPGLLGLDESRREVARLQDEALAALEPFGDAARELAQLCRELAVRTH